MPKRKKYPRLPNGYGSIRYLGKGRNNPYAVHPPGDIEGNRPKAIAYVDTWTKGFLILTALKAGTYKPGMEADFDATEDAQCIKRIIADYSRFRGAENRNRTKTFSEVYEAFFEDKYGDGCKLSASAVRGARAAYGQCRALHDKNFAALTAADLQAVLDGCTRGIGTVNNIKTLFNGMYRFAESRSWCEKRYDKFVKVKQEDDTEHGVPFTDTELEILWMHRDDENIRPLIIMCYSGWRISELASLTVHADERYMQGGVKTKAGKGRIVPIHPAIMEFVLGGADGSLLPCSVKAYRVRMDKALTRYGLQADPKHTPHDCRHTFSRLCEKYGVRENDRKRLLGHSFQDVTNAVYGHRDIEDLRNEIEKIPCPKRPASDKE